MNGVTRILWPEDQSWRPKLEAGRGPPNDNFGSKEGGQMKRSQIVASLFLVDDDVE